jgi:hypothetical protein
MGRDGMVGIATCYGWDGAAIESLWKGDFPRPSRSALGSSQSPVQWTLGLFPRDKAAGDGSDHPPQSRIEVKERVGWYSNHSLGLHGVF